MDSPRSSWLNRHRRSIRNTCWETGSEADVDVEREARVRAAVSPEIGCRRAAARGGSSESDDDGEHCGYPSYGSDPVGYPGKEPGGDLGDAGLHASHPTGRWITRRLLGHVAAASPCVIRIGSGSGTDSNACAVSRLQAAWSAEQRIRSTDVIRPGSRSDRDAASVRAVHGTAAGGMTRGRQKSISALAWSGGSACDRRAHQPGVRGRCADSEALHTGG